MSPTLGAMRRKSELRRARACALETVDAGTVEDVHLPMFVVVNDACIDVKILLLHLLLAPLLAPCHLLIQK